MKCIECKYYDTCMELYNYDFCKLMKYFIKLTKIKNKIQKIRIGSMKNEMY